jgi:hypothetical protein
VLLSSELDHERNQVHFFLMRRFVTHADVCVTNDIFFQMWLRIVAGSLASALFGYTLYFMVVQLSPSRENFSYWDQHDDWN